MVVTTVPSEITARNFADEVSLRRDHVQAFNRLFQQALNAKQFEVTSLANTELAEQLADDFLSEQRMWSARRRDRDLFDGSAQLAHNQARN